MSSIAIDHRIRGDLGRGTPMHALFRGRNGVVAALIIGFIVFLPYPALSIGGNTGIQLGDVFSLLFALPLVFLSWKRNPYYLFGLILVPLMTSCLKVAILREPGLDICLKTSISTGIWCITLLTAQLFLPTFFLEVMTGVAIACLLHVFVGVWQIIVFQTGGDLPLQFLYHNPSFLSVIDNADNLVKYEQRPFGIFPEPSAMSTCLAPVALLWLAEMFGLIKFVSTPARWQKILFATASVSSMLLIIVSRSGHAMVTLAVALIFGLVWLKNARATWRNYLSVLTVFGVLLPLILWMTYLAVSDRVSEIDGANTSWQDRSYSLVLGFQIWISGGIWDVLFGMGGGRAAEAMQASPQHLEAVFSILLSFIYENGLVSLAVAAWIGMFLLSLWRSIRFNLAFGGILLVWFVGITFTSSYNQLLPIWFGLGLLTVWPSLVRSPEPAKRSRAIPEHRRAIRPAPVPQVRPHAGLRLSTNPRHPEL